MKTKDLVYMAMYLALFIVFDYLSNLIPVLHMPNGGTIGLGVIPLIICSYHLGYKKGIVVGLLSILLMFMTGTMYIVDPIQFVLEYPLAFGIYGICCLFPNYKVFYSGVVVTNLIRFVCHLVAGTIYWGMDWYGSFIYNSGYMFATMLVCLVLVPLLVPRIKELAK